MDQKKIASDFLFAAGAQFLGFLSGTIMTLVVPKVIGVHEYSFWQLFIFYATYVGLFRLGIDDGIYLIKGGQVRSEIDKSSIKSQFILITSFQSLVAVGIILLALFGPFEMDRSFVITAAAIQLVVANAITFLTVMFQTVNETRLFSFAIALIQLFMIMFMAVLMLLGVGEFEYYVISYLVAEIIGLLYCFIKARDFLRARGKAFDETWGETATYVRAGIKLMLATLASSFIIGIVQFSVDLLWGIESFGQLSLALAFVNFFITFVSQLGLVLFPALRRAENEEVKGFLARTRDYSALLLPVIYALYFPMLVVLQWWLPQYESAFIWIGVLLPVCVFDGGMKICYLTYYKTYRKESELLALNVAAVVLSGVSVLICLVWLQSLEATLYCIITIIMLRSLFAEFRMNRFLQLPPSQIMWGQIAITLAFIVIVNVCAPLPAALIIALVYAAYLLIGLRVVRKGE